jgi:ferredoxin-type protein NapF
MGDNCSISRRRFLRLHSAGAVGTTYPPWSNEVAISAACTGCGACVSACPQAIIRLDINSLPAIDFRMGECTFCGSCAEICPEPVFDRSVTPAFQHFAVIGNSCFAVGGIVCQTCGDCCPEAAIRLVPRRGGPAIPSLATDRCNGCGACIAACPADAIRIMPRSLNE